MAAIKDHHFFTHKSRIFSAGFAFFPALLFALMLFVPGVSATWLNASYPNRLGVDCSNVPAGTQISVNGSGFTLPGSATKQVVWIACQSDISLYYINASLYTFGNLTEYIPFDVEIGLVASYNPTLVWPGAYVVNHLTNSCADSGPNNVGCVIHGSLTQIQNNTCGFGKCYNFDGTDSANYIELNTKPILGTIGTGALTLEYFGFWNPTGTDYMTYVSDSLFGAGWTGFHFERLANQPANTFNIGNNGINSANISLAAFHYFSGTRPGTFFVDGNVSVTLVSGDTNTTNANSNANFTLGRNPDGTYMRPGRGTIDEVRIMNYARTPAAVSAIYKNYQGQAGYGTLQGVESLSHNLTWVTQPPNITFASGQTIRIQQNATCSQGDISAYAVNDSRFTINASGYMVNASFGVSRGNFSFKINASDTAGNSIFSFFEAALTCTASFYCSAYDNCTGNNITACLAVSDSVCMDTYGGDLSAFNGACACNSTYACGSYGACNGFDVLPCLSVNDVSSCNRTFAGNISAFNSACVCNSTYSCNAMGACLPANYTECLGAIDSTCGRAYNGSLAVFNENCTYTPPGPGFTINMGAVTEKTILLFILVFFWLALLTLTLIFRQFITGSIMFAVGLWLAYMIAGYTLVGGIFFLIFDIIAFVALGVSQ